MNHRKHKYIVALLMLICLSTGCTWNKKRQDINLLDDDFEVVDMNANEIEHTISVQKKDLTKIQYYNGQVTPAITELSFPENAIFEEYMVRLGDKVKEGQILATPQMQEEQENIKNLNKKMETLIQEHNSNIRHYNTQIEILNIELKDSKLDDISRLKNKYSLKKQMKLRDQEEIMYQLESERINYKLTYFEDTIHSSMIIAPHDGVVTYLANITKGNYIHNSKACITLTDESKTLVALDKFVFRGTAKEYNKQYAIKNGKEYKLTYQPRSALECAKYEQNELENYTTMLFNEIDSSISYGDNITVIFEGETIYQVLTIPQNVVKADSGGSYVYIKQNGMNVKTYIKVGTSDLNNYEVISGLKEGDVVIAKK